MKPPRTISQWSILAVLVAVVAVAGYIVVHLSHAATGDVVVPASTASLPVPTQGVYWGGSLNGDTDSSVPGCSGADFALLECKVAWAGNAQGLTVSPTPYASTSEHFYIVCGDPDGNLQQGGTIWKSAHTSGRKMLLISMKCGDWGSLGSGGGKLAADSNIRDKVDLITRLGVPVLLVFNHEPEDDSCGSGANQGSPDDYRAASRQFTADVRGEENKLGVHTISIGWTLMNQAFTNTKPVLFTSCSQSNIDAARRTAANFYPGDDAIDWITPDAYVRGSNSFADTVQPFYDWATTCPAVHPTSNYNCTNATHAAKPMGIAETGVSASQTTTQRAKVLNEMRTTLATTWPRIRMIAYWDTKGPVQDNHIDEPASDTTHTVLKAFAKAELDPAIHKLVFGTATPDPSPTPSPSPSPSSSPGGDTTLPTVSISSPANNATVSGPVSVTYTASDNIGVTKLNFLVDGTYLAHPTNPNPYSFDTTAYADGVHTIQVRAEDAAGNVGGSQVISLTIRNHSSTPTPSASPTLLGDVNGDGHVNITDLSMLNSHWGTNYAAADFNHDNIVGITDLSILLSHWTG